MPTHTPTAQSGTTRLSGFDSLRAVAMLLGVVLHVSLAFMPGIDRFIGWPMIDSSPHPLFGLVVVAIHAVRMPLFFFVSGLLTALSIGSGGPGRALRSRLTRIGVPFLVGLVTILPLIRFAAAFAVTHGGAQSDEGAWAVFIADYQSDSFIGRLSPGHLWFLEYLLIFVVAACIVFACFARAGRAMTKTPWKRSTMMWANLVAAGLVVFFMSRMKSVGIDTPESIIPDWHLLGFYGVFFAGGCIAAFKAPNLTELIPFPRIAATLGVVLTIGCAFGAIIADGMARGINTPMVTGAAAFIKPFNLIGQAFLWIAILGTCACAAQPRPPLSGFASRVFRSAYWTYLVHLPIAWILHALLRDVGGDSGLAGVMRFLLVIFATLVVSQITFEMFVARTPLGRFLDLKPRNSMDNARTRPANTEARRPVN